MRLLSAPLLAALAASTTTTLGPRQESSPIRISAVTPFCSEGRPTAPAVDSKGTVVTVPFTDAIIRPEASPDAECRLEIEMTYPPGCHTVVLDTQVMTFLSGPESVTATADVVVALSNGRSAHSVDKFTNLDNSVRNNTGQYNTKYPIDASIAVNEDTPRVVTFTLDMGLHIESSNNDEGALFEVEAITVEIDHTRTDPDWEGCL
ncbi:uncharacterized protein DNG_10275 [Cephalotrichum gorgonifer]|uniref:Ubiquitin 3 binding protein But2 C-terminal domain-containing protein n=1 Tax=Cephalotrichum gorgonifer TaxID=2041049 RepID=A0AAE8N7A5_9PEZI|nr:uncharacterized protein DNG_10275 [Cephalotrichum gorgonifer]